MLYYNTLYYILFFLYRLVITMRLPIVTLYLLSVGYSLIEIGFGYSIMSIAAIIGEIPLGYMADKVSKRIILALSVVLQSLSSILFIHNNGVGGLYFAFALLGIGGSSPVGVLQSWYVNIYNKSVRNYSLSKIFKTTQIMSNIATFLGIMLGALITEKLSYTFTFYFIAIALVVYALLVVLLLQSTDSLQNQKNNNNVIYFRDFMLIFKDIKVMSILIFSSTLGFIYGGYAVIWAPIFKTLVGNKIQNSLVKSSFLYGLLYLLSGIALIYTNRILVKWNKNLQLQLYILRIIFGGTFIIMGCTTENIYIFSITTLIMFIVGYMEYAPLQEMYNSFLPDNYRALGLSISNTFEAVLGSIGSFILSATYSYSNVNITLFLMGGIAFLSILPIQKAFFTKSKE